MTGGKINDNSAGGGGGVTIRYKADFTMIGGEISGNTSDYGGGIYAYSYGYNFTLGGTAVITGNINNNAYLDNVGYITLSTNNPPATGMNVGVSKRADGVIVDSGASAEVANFFYADELGKTVFSVNDQLVITSILP